MKRKLKTKKQMLDDARFRIRTDLEWHRARDWRDPDPEMYPPEPLERAARHRMRSSQFHAVGE